VRVEVVEENRVRQIAVFSENTAFSVFFKVAEKKGSGNSAKLTE
jgi:hypothetical protein